MSGQILPHETALAELSRVAEESTRVRALARVLTNAIRRRIAASGEAASGVADEPERPDVVADEDVALIRESRRDQEHSRLICEGLARRWGLDAGGAS